MDWEFPPLLPGRMHELSAGLSAEPGQRLRRKLVHDAADGTRHWDGTYEHQSTGALVHRLVSHIKSQRQWSRENAFDELTDVRNLGGRWLQVQDEPLKVFEEMWESAYVRPPKVSLKDLATALLMFVEANPGIQLVYLREYAATAGWRNRGHVDDLVTGLVAAGRLREERTYGPNGGCTSRRVWSVCADLPERAAMQTTVTVALCLRALAEQRHMVKGHRTPVRERSYLRLLTDKRLRSEGLRRLRRQLARLRPGRSRRPRRISRDPLVLTKIERDILLAELGGLVDDWLAADSRVAPLSAKWLPCLV